MIVFRANLILGTLLGLILAVAPGGGVWAQPKELVAPDQAPPPPPPQDKPMVPLADGAATNWVQPRSVAPVPGRPIGTAVAITPLSASADMAVGSLSADAGGLGLNIWNGSARVVVDSLVARLPAAQSPAMMDLTRRLLLTAAKPPGGPGGDRPFLATRAEALYRAGFLNDAVMLAEGAARSRGGEAEATARTRAAALLLLGDPQKACSQLAISQDSGEPFWLKLRAFCFHQSGAEPAAMLNRDLMTEREIKAPLFLALFDHVTGFGPAPDTELYRGELGPVELALHRQTGKPLPATAVEGAAAPVLEAVALTALEADGRAPEIYELSAAEHMAAAGVFALSDLRTLYRRVGFDLPILDQAITIADTLPGPHARALLYQAILRSTSDTSTARLVSSALMMSANQSEGVPLLLARLSSDSGQRIFPTPALTDAALDIARVDLAGGHYDAAQDWFDLLGMNSAKTINVAMTTPINAQSFHDPHTIQARALRAMLTVATPSERLPFWPELGYTWREYAQAGAEQPRRIATELVLLEAIGYPITADLSVWARDLLAADWSVAPMIRDGLIESAMMDRVGETIARALVLLSEGGPAASHPLSVAAAAHALMRVGLEDEARAIALEHLLNRPLSG